MPAKRGAPGETSPYARTNPSGTARIRSSTASRRSAVRASPLLSARCAMGPIQSWPSTRRPASSAWRCSRTGSASARCARGRGRGSARWRRSRSSSPPTARTRSTVCTRTSTPSRRSASCSPPTRSPHVRQVAVIDVRGVIATHTGKDCIAHAGHVTGEHHSCQANMMARDTVPQAMSDAFVGVHGRAAGPPARRARRGGGRRRRRPRPPVGGDGRRPAPTASRGGGPSTCAWRTTARRWTSCAACSRSSAPTTSRAPATSCSPRAGPRRPASLYQRAAELAPDSDELLFWSGLAIAQAGDLDGGVAAVRRAAEENPNWLVLLDRLSPEFAPAGEAVRQQIT